MGTRGLTAVVLDGEYKVAQYGQWDHYLSGQGDTICKFIQEDMDLIKFKAALKECSWISTEEHKAMLAECGADPESEFVQYDVSDKFNAKYPHLSRDVGGEILDYVQNKGARLLKNSIGFAGDSLFCEWAYILDLDNEVLEVYKGFNKAELDSTERFCNPEGITLEESKEYNPIGLYRKFPFAIATPYAMNKLENINYSEDEDGEIDMGSPSDYDDDYFVQPPGDIVTESDEEGEVEVPTVLGAFETFVTALSEATDEELFALREFAKDVYEV